MLTYLHRLTEQAMPFASDKQRRWMYKNKPEMAQKWAKKGKKGPKKGKNTRKKLMEKAVKGKKY